MTPKTVDSPPPYSGSFESVDKNGSDAFAMPHFDEFFTSVADQRSPGTTGPGAIMRDAKNAIAMNERVDAFVRHFGDADTRRKFTFKCGMTLRETLSPDKGSRPSHAP